MVKNTNILKTHTDSLLIINKFELQSLGSYPPTLLSKNFIQYIERDNYITIV